MLTDSIWASLGGMLLVVVLVMAAAVWFTRWIAKNPGFQRRYGQTARQEQLRVLSQTRLGKDQFLAVAQAGQRFLLLGVTPQSISLLAEISREEAAPWLPETNDGEKEEHPTFQQAFVSILQQRKKR